MTCITLRNHCLNGENIEIMANGLLDYSIGIYMSLCTSKYIKMILLPWRTSI